MCFFRKKKKKLKEEALKKEAEVKQEPVDEVDDTEVIEEGNKTTVLGTKVYHVNKRASDSQWTVKFAKGSKVIRLFKTKAEAMEYANELADRQGGIVLFHASKGKHKGKIIKQGWDAYKGKDEASTVPLDDDNDYDDIDVAEGGFEDTKVVEEENKTTVLGTKVYHVNKRKNDTQWEVKYVKDGNKVSKLFTNKAQALDYANDLAEAQGGVVLFHASKK